MVERIDAITARHGVRIAAGAHAGDGNRHPTCVLHPADGAAIATAHHAFDGIFSRAGAGRARSPAKTAWDSPSCGIVESLVQPPARCQRRWATTRSGGAASSSSPSKPFAQPYAPSGSGTRRRRRAERTRSHLVALEDGECSGALTFVCAVRAVIADPNAGPNEHAASVVEEGERGAVGDASAQDVAAASGAHGKQPAAPGS
jgi:FAD-dependent oxidoreductase family protein